MRFPLRMHMCLPFWPGLLQEPQGRAVPCALAGSQDPWGGSEKRCQRFLVPESSTSEGWEEQTLRIAPSPMESWGAGDRQEGKASC